MICFPKGMEVAKFCIREESCAPCFYSVVWKNGWMTVAVGGAIPLYHLKEPMKWIVWKEAQIR